MFCKDSSFVMPYNQIFRMKTLQWKMIVEIFEVHLYTALCCYIREALDSESSIFSFHLFELLVKKQTSVNFMASNLKTYKNEKKGFKVLQKTQFLNISLFVLTLTSL